MHFFYKIIMIMLHFNKFEINSELKSREIMVLLSEHTVPKELFRFSNKEFSGIVKNNYFKIYRNTTYYNGSAAIVIGRVHASGHGSKVSIIIRPKIFALLFVSIWYSYAVFDGIMEIFSINRPNGFSFAPFGLLFFGIIMFSISFWRDASKIKIKLIQLLS